jgi:hypothetical protein
MALIRTAAFLVAALAGALLAGCTDAAFSLGDRSDIIWWTDHETGDLSDWTGSVPPGGFIIPGASRIEVVKGVSRSGDYGLLIQDNNLDRRDFALAARNGPLPIEVYCSAWYYLPAPVHPKTYWWFVDFRSRHPPYDSGGFRDEVNVSFTTRADGSVGTRVSSPDLGDVAPLVDRPIPIGRWFHIEVFHRTGTDASGLVQVWQDGELTFNVPGRNSETSYAEWMIGAVVDALTTDEARLYIDDAAISKRRLGPLPPFVRD